MNSFYEFILWIHINAANCVILDSVYYFSEKTLLVEWKRMVIFFGNFVSQVNIKWASNFKRVEYSLPKNYAEYVNCRKVDLSKKISKLGDLIYRLNFQIFFFFWKCAPSENQISKEVKQFWIWISYYKTRKTNKFGTLLFKLFPEILQTANRANWLHLSDLMGLKATSIFNWNRHWCCSKCYLCELRRSVLGFTHF